MTEIILIAVIALLIYGTYKFLKKDEKESIKEEIVVPELDLPTLEETPVQEPVKEVKAISKPKKTTETKKTPAKKKGRPKKSQ